MQPDERSIAALGFVLGLALSILTILVWSTKRMYAGFGRWTCAVVLFTISPVLLSQRGIWSDWLTIVLANALSVCSLILALNGSREFLGLKTKPWWNAAITGFTILSFSYFTFVHNSIQFRIVEYSFVCAAILGWNTATLVRFRLPGPNLGLAIVGAGFGLHAVIELERGIYYLFHAIPSEALLNSPMSKSYAILISLLAILINAGVFLMHYERLLTEREEEVKRTGRANKELTDLKEHLEETVRQRTAELHQVQKLDSIGRLAGGVAHDFNNLLTVIGGHAALLLQKLQPGSSLLYHIDRINQAADQAQTLTRQLLAFARRQDLHPVVLNLNDVLREMDGILRPFIGSEVDLVVALDPSECCVTADPGLIQQVIVNLAINARDAMPDGGHLLIETSIQNVGEGSSRERPDTTPGPHVVLTVSDSGAGMDAETQSKIFEPFFTTKGPGKGTGLGLASVYGIVRQSGGHIQVESEPGKGTTFRIHLPLAVRPRVISSVPETPRRFESRMGSILLVEDQEQVRELACDILKTCGYEVLLASNGNEAISVFEKNRESLQLVITDVRMPELNGINLVRHLRALRPEIKVLYISGYADDLDALMDSGGTAAPFLRKPFTDDELRTRVRALLSAV